MHICKGTIAKKIKIEGMSHFWFFAILIEYITEKCQGGNPANGAWIVLSSFSHLFFLKSSIISELKRIKNAMLVNS